MFSPECYSLINKDNSARMESTSGGAFSLLAASFIRRGGVVCGAAYSDGVHSVVHRCIDNVAEIGVLRKSKYVESEFADALKQCLSFLKNGRRVLFVGTPCQVAAVRKASGCPDNLFVCDLVCHGVPAKSVWKSYLSFLENELESEILKVDFRSKQKGWNLSRTILQASNGKKWCHISNNDPYMYAFYKGYSLRQSCLKCTDLKEHRVGDVTLGDCWHVGKYSKGMDDNHGTSLLLVNTSKGAELLHNALEESAAVCKPYPYDFAKMNNSALARPANVDVAARERFQVMLAGDDNTFWRRLIPVKTRFHNRVVYAAKRIFCCFGVPI